MLRNYSHLRAIPRTTLRTNRNYIQRYIVPLCAKIRDLVENSRNNRNPPRHPPSRVIVPTQVVLGGCGVWVQLLKRRKNHNPRHPPSRVIVPTQGYWGEGRTTRGKPTQHRNPPRHPPSRVIVPTQVVLGGCGVWVQLLKCVLF
ncbi:hypothetical protein Pelo_621 [Pelomyxa schiedti]|nr:hypothetical protein Pelo_621 [Pelomyxa schiedti]